MSVINIANGLTLLRLIFTPITIFFLFENPVIPNRILSTLVSVISFTLASLTDYYDGYLARKYHLASKFGEFFDPLVDKIFTLSVFIAFTFIAHIQIGTFLLAFIIGREILITGIRMTFLFNNQRMQTEKHGKVKTVVQIVAQAGILLILLHNSVLMETQLYQSFIQINPVLDASNITAFYEYCSYPTWLARSIFWLPNLLILLAAYITVKSGIVYLKNNWELIYIKKV